MNDIGVGKPIDRRDIERSLQRRDLVAGLINAFFDGPAELCELLGRERFLHVCLV